MCVEAHRNRRETVQLSPNHVRVLRRNEPAAHKRVDPNSTLVVVHFGLRARARDVSMERCYRR